MNNLELNYYNIIRFGFGGTEEAAADLLKLIRIGKATKYVISNNL